MTNQPLPKEIHALKSKVMMRTLAMTAAFAMTLMMAAQLAGVRINLWKPVPATVGILGVLGVLRMAFDRATYLPFLEECALPSTILTETVPKDAAVTVAVTVDRGASHVVYWASESGSGTAPTPWDAYSNYGNAGVARAGTDGSATLAVRCPGRYKVRGKKLPRHVHYRAVYPSGIAGSVQTVNVECV